MPESARTRMLRWGFNLFPAYRATGARVEYVAHDFREVRIRLPLRLRTRNYVGTIFGGSMYGAVDPVYMLMLIRTLGPEYVVWDKSASIRFRKPGRSTLYARFTLDEAELDAIRVATADGASTDRVYRVELADAEGTVHAEVEKTLYVRRKDARRPEREPPAAGRTQEV
jgi:acyl-coenzyme A thioesterase PaaI-like protein